MIGLLQRVSNARVEVEGQLIASTGTGLLVLIGIEKNDTEAKADRLTERLLGYRVFEDEQGKMNLSLRDVNGELLLVPQFTLPADTKKGTRPGFSSAAAPETGRKLFDYLVAQAKVQHSAVQSGQFGSDMQVSLTNSGPVTFWLQT